MSSNDELFFGLVEQLIDTANDAPEALDLTEIGGAMMCAAARFNAYALAASSMDKRSFAEDRDQALSDFTAQFKRLMAEDLDDYIENYKVMIGNKVESLDD